MMPKIAYLLSEKKILGAPLFLFGILIIITFIFTLQNIFLSPKSFVPEGIQYTQYNNYVIFKQSFFHLIENKDLYKLYPNEHWDLYKYSPAFSLLMAPLAFLPNAVGLFLWNLLNVMILFFALWKLPGLTFKPRLFSLGFILIELITSIQNSQSNPLITGLILFAFIFLEKKNIAAATLCIALTVFIKIFGVIMLLLFIFYTDKMKTFFYMLLWTILLFIMPLLVVSPSQLIFLYQSWYHLLQNDFSASYGLSVAGWLHSWFSIDSKNYLLIAGSIFIFLPLLKFKCFNDLKFRLFFLSSLLIWSVIFNHKAESPTFIIAVCGVAVWFFSQKLKTENIVLMLTAFIFTVLSPTDIFPKNIRDLYVIPYVLKAVPCIFIWGKITWDLLFYKTEIPEKSVVEKL